MSEDKNVIKIPIDSKQRQINEKGEFYVPCDLSDRWLQFNDVSEIVGGRELITFSVMTLDKNESPYRLFNMTVERNDIERALNMIESINQK